MEMDLVKAEVRQPGGRTANNRLRRDGMIPAIIYGHKETPEAISLSEFDLRLALEHKHHMIRVLIDGKETPYLLKEVQYDHFGAKLKHVDLMRVDLTERVKSTVPVVFKGDAVGVRHGGSLITTLDHVDVFAKAEDIPDELFVDISELAIGHSLHVSDINFPAGVEAASPAADVVCSIQGKKDDEDTDVDAEGDGQAEPEVISRGKAESDEDA